MTVGIYAADGSINVTVVDGSTYTGLYAADGSYNVVVNDGSTYTGSTHPCGAYNVVVYTSGQPTLFAPNGSFYVSVSPYTEGTLKVTTVSGGFGDFTLTWDGDTVDSTPDFTVTDLPALAVSDVVTLYFDGTPYANTIDAGETALLSLDFATGSQLNGTYSAYATHVRGGTTLTSNTVTVTINVPLVAPVNTVAPVISGLTTIGSTLSCTTGTWTGYYTPTYTYQWKRGGVNIGGATSSTYVTTSADASANITCTVTGTNTAGSASATSNTITMNALSPFTYLTGDYYDSGYSVSTRNFTVDFGTISGTKTAILGVASTYSSASAVTVTIAGNSMTQVVGTNATGLRIDIFKLDLTSGGSKTVTITTPVAFQAVAFGVGLMEGLNTTQTATDYWAAGFRASPTTLFDGSSGNGVGTQSVPSGGIGIFASATDGDTLITVSGGTAHTQITTGSGSPKRFMFGSTDNNTDPAITHAAYSGEVHVMAAWGP